jgi:hypothetical protein
MTISILSSDTIKLIRLEDLYQMAELCFEEDGGVGLRGIDRKAGRQQQPPPDVQAEPVVLGRENRFDNF